MFRGDKADHPGKWWVQYQISQKILSDQMTGNALRITHTASSR